MLWVIYLLQNALRVMIHFAILNGSKRDDSFHIHEWFEWDNSFVDNKWFFSIDLFNLSERLKHSGSF